MNQPLSRLRNFLKKIFDYYIKVKKDGSENSTGISNGRWTGHLVHSVLGVQGGVAPLRHGQQDVLHLCRVSYLLC
jgi:hypothetical protein